MVPSRCRCIGNLEVFSKTLNRPVTLGERHVGSAPSDRYVMKECGIRSTAMKYKDLELDQKEIDFAKRYFGVDSDQEAI
jgi:hypothetical protein